ncbi:MAG: LytR/AlgR family response regulator transcription factor [Thermaurantimonas sp.]|uniref:LytR/AlgR family response regulator transcription factor n=1 Tax=Thermaurantimonas sp. TaxID=2681568 RepID=UPI00391BDC2B
MEEQKITALIVDDELHARRGLQSLLAEHFPDITVLGEAKDLPEAVRLINELHPTVIFLDVEMPGYSGTQIFDFFPSTDVDFKIIFVTAYSEYAVTAFELSAIDYILKPITLEALNRAITKLKVALQADKSLEKERLQALIANIQNPEDARLVLPSNDGQVVIKLNDIVFLKADSSYTEIYLADGSKLFLSRKLLEFEKLQNYGPFMRTHRSYIVNLNRIKKILKQDGGLLMDNGREVALAADKKNLLYEKLNALRF